MHDETGADGTWLAMSPADGVLRHCASPDEALRWWLDLNQADKATSSDPLTRDDGRPTYCHTLDLDTRRTRLLFVSHQDDVPARVQAQPPLYPHADRPHERQERDVYLALLCRRGGRVLKVVTAAGFDEATAITNPGVECSRHIVYRRLNGKGLYVVAFTTSNTVLQRVDLAETLPSPRNLLYLYLAAPGGGEAVEQFPPF